MAGRKRKANFTNSELEAMITTVISNYAAIKHKDNSDQIKAAKAKAWQLVLAAVNATNVTAEPRTLNEVLKKVSDLKSATKRKLSKLKRDRSLTGGGSCSAQQLTALERLVSEVIQEEEIVGLSTPEIGLNRRTCEAEAVSSNDETEQVIILSRISFSVNYM